MYEQGEKKVMDFKIEKGVPQPTKRGSKFYNSYPFREMKVGDSFFVPKDSVNEASFRSAVAYFALRHQEYRFTVRREDNGGLRVWRIPVEQ